MENIRKACLNNVHNIRSASTDRDFPCRICYVDYINEKYKIKTPPQSNKLYGVFI